MTVQKFKLPKGIDHVTVEGRASYPHLFVPKFKYNSTTDKEYTIEVLFEDGADLRQFQKDSEKAVEEVFGANKTKWPANINWALKDQQELIDYAAGKGQIYDHLKAGNKFARFKTSAKNKAPGVYDANVKELMDPTQMYGGCYVKVKTNIKCVVVNKNVYVVCYLQMVQKLRDGDSFGSRSDPAEAFQPVTYDVQDPLS